MLEIEHRGVTVPRGDLVVGRPNPGPDTEKVLPARHQDSSVCEVSNTNTVQGLQAATLILVILPGLVPALYFAVSRLGTGRAGQGGGEGAKAVVTVAGVEWRQENGAVGFLSEQDLASKDTLTGRDKPAAGFI